MLPSIQTLGRAGTGFPSAHRWRNVSWGCRWGHEVVSGLGRGAVRMVVGQQVWGGRRDNGKMLRPTGRCRGASPPSVMRGRHAASRGPWSLQVAPGNTGTTAHTRTCSLKGS